MSKVFEEIKNSMEGWKGQVMLPIEWLSALNEAVGFLCFHVNQGNASRDDKQYEYEAYDCYRDDFPDVAAIVIAMIRAYDCGLIDTDQVFREIKMERARQDEKFGEQNHSPIEWLGILSEEIGEVSQVVVDNHFGFNNVVENYREELIQVAAVCVNAMESYDRGKRREA